MLKSDKPCNLTEYTVEFKKHDHQRRGMIRPPLKMVPHDAKMESSTTNRRDFIAFPVTPPVKRSHVPFQPPDKKMHSATEYKNEYLGKWQAPTQPIYPPRNEKDNDEPFNDTTTHTADYSAPPITPRELYKPPNSYKPPKTPFNTVTTTRSDFVDHGKVPMTPSLKPRAKSTGSTQPLDEITSYRSMFTTPTMPKRYQKPNRVYVPPSEKLSDSTTFRCAFLKYPNSSPRQLIKPPCHSHCDRVPLETNTTNKLTYKNWEIPKRFSRPPTTFIPPTEKISDQTTSRLDYTDYGHMPPTVSYKPVQKTRDQMAPFESLTTQSVDYKAWCDAKRPEPFSQDKQYEPPKEKFNCTTTFQAHYKGEYAARAPNAKPPHKTPEVTSEMDAMTSYKENYSGPGYKPCPGVRLLTNDTKTGNFIFAHEGRKGHKLYKPLSNN